MRGRKNSTPGCSFSGCLNKSKAAGLCPAHRDQFRRGGPLVALHQYRRKPCSFDGCGNTAHCRGLCNGHDSQRRNGRALGPLGGGRRPAGSDAALIAEILSRPPTDECIVWTNWLDPDGYARTRNGGRSRQVTRIVLEAVGRPVPDGECACHTCDNRACVNERHLWAGSHGANIADRDAKRRNAVGEGHGAAKLSDESIRQIRAARQAGASQQTIANRFGVSQPTISSILRGETWGHVE